MSSSVCHAPLPARMEAFTTRICLRAVDQYEKFLKPSYFSKFSNNQKDTRDRLKDAETRQYTALKYWKKNNNQKNININNNIQNNRYDKNNSNNDKNYKSISVYDITMTTLAPSPVPSPGTTPGNSPSNTPAVTPDRTTPTIILTTPKLSQRNLSKEINWPTSFYYPSPADVGSSVNFLAINCIDLSAPASHALINGVKKNQWFQLSGHKNGFAPAGCGTIWKRITDDVEQAEVKAYTALSKDPEFVDWIPRYHRFVKYEGESFIELQDLLFGFTNAHVIDIKLGKRTFLESEVSKTNARKDLYQKMVAVDPAAPTDEERETEAITKLRYMQFREQQSSTCSHGFRIEAMKLPGSPPITDLKKVKSHADVIETLKKFIKCNKEIKIRILTNLKRLRSKIEKSTYFKKHEMVGTSIFMIYDESKVGMWLIDFAKTREVPEGIILNHRSEWRQGNHEEGLLSGLDKLISSIQEVEC